MAWKTIRGRRYYYRTTRRGGVHRTIYVGGGAAGRLAAEEDRQRKEQARQGRQQRVAIGLRLQEVMGQREKGRDWSVLLLHASLILLGYRRQRRQWKRRKETSMDLPRRRPRPALPPKPQPASELPSKEEFQLLVDNANRGNPDATARLRQLLDDCPDIWQLAGDLNQIAEERVIEHIGANNFLLRESLKRQIAEMRRGLYGAAPTQMRRLLVDRLLIAWLRKQYIEVRYPTVDGLSEAAARLVLRQRESAERLLTSAEDALHTYSKLSQPQLRIAPASSPPDDLVQEKRAVNAHRQQLARDLLQGSRSSVARGVLAQEGPTKDPLRDLELDPEFQFENPYAKSGCTDRLELP